MLTSLLLSLSFPCFSYLEPFLLHSMSPFGSSLATHIPILSLPEILRPPNDLLILCLNSHFDLKKVSILNQCQLYSCGCTALRVLKKLKKDFVGEVWCRLEVRSWNIWILEALLMYSQAGETLLNKPLSGPPEEVEGFLLLEVFQQRLVDYSTAALCIWWWSWGRGTAEFDFFNSQDFRPVV